MTDENTRLPSDSVELKPCPFCEADAYFEGGLEERDDRRYFSMTVCCGSCEATITEAINFTEYSKLGERGAYQRLGEMCSAAWNSRAALVTQPRDDVRQHPCWSETLGRNAHRSYVHDGDMRCERCDAPLNKDKSERSQTDEQPAITDMTDAECATAYRDLRRRANDAGFATVGEWIDEQPETDGLAVFDEDDLIDEIAEAISDSFDVDWTARDGARHVVGLLEHKGLIALAEGEGK